MSYQKLNFKVHVEICEKMFAQVVKVAKDASVVSNPIQESVSCIYKAASKIVHQFINDQQAIARRTRLSPTSPVSSASSVELDETSIDSSDSDSCRSMDFVCKDKNVQSYLQELILITTFAGSASTQSPSQLMDKTGRPVSVRSMLISLAVYWGVAASLLGQEDQELSRSIELLMSTNITYIASISIQDDVLRLLSNTLLSTSSSSSSTHPAAALCSRLSAAVRTSFKTPLLFTVLLGLSMHSELSLKQVDFSVVDQSCIRLVHMMSSIAPRDGLIAAEGSGCTPLAIVASFHSPVRSHTNEDCNLSLSLARILCERCPSALTVPCGRSGLHPLHLAARDGETCVMQFIAQRFPYTVTMKDSYSRYALQLALEHSYLHTETALLQLAQTYLPAVFTNREQVLLFSRQKNVSVHMSEALIDMCGRCPTSQPVCEGECDVSVRSESPRSVVSPIASSTGAGSPVSRVKKGINKHSSTVAKDLKSTAAYVMPTQVAQKFASRGSIMARPLVSLSAFASVNAERETMFSVADSLLALNCVSSSESLSSASSDSVSSFEESSRGGFKNAMKRRMTECAMDTACAKTSRLC